MSAATKIAVAALDALTDKDPEAAHGEADIILVQYLRDQGYAVVADAWDRAKERIGFWYA